MIPNRRHGRFFLDAAGNLTCEVVEYEGVDLSGEPVFSDLASAWGEGLAHCLVTTGLLAERSGIVVQVVDCEGTAWDTSYPVFPVHFREALATIDHLTGADDAEGIREYPIVIGFSTDISLQTQDEIERTAVLCASKSIGFRYIFTLFYVRCQGGLIGIRRAGGREVEQFILEGPGEM